MRPLVYIVSIIFCTLIKHCVYCAILIVLCCVWWMLEQRICFGLWWAVNCVIGVNVVYATIN